LKHSRRAKDARPRPALLEFRSVPARTEYRDCVRRLASSMIRLAMNASARSPRSASPRATRAISKATPMTRLASGSKSVLSKNCVMGMTVPRLGNEQSYTSCLCFVSQVPDKRCHNQTDPTSRKWLRWPERIPMLCRMRRQERESHQAQMPLSVPRDTSAFRPVPLRQERDQSLSRRRLTRQSRW
jgi:hypothetical protein